MADSYHICPRYGMAEHIWAKLSPNMFLELEGILFWMTICFEVYGPDDSTQMRAIYGLATAHHGMC